jgi:hypothetical protein
LFDNQQIRHMDARLRKALPALERNLEKNQDLIESVVDALQVSEIVCLEAARRNETYAPCLFDGDSGERVGPQGGEWGRASMLSVQFKAGARTMCQA